MPARIVDPVVGHHFPGRQEELLTTEKHWLTPQPRRRQALLQRPFGLLGRHEAKVRPNALTDHEACRDAQYRGGKSGSLQRPDRGRSGRASVAVDDRRSMAKKIS